MTCSQDLAVLLRQTMRQLSNRLQSAEAVDIALAGSRRSGSTLLMEVIAHQKGMKSINHPFAVPIAASAPCRLLDSLLTRAPQVVSFFGISYE